MDKDLLKNLNKEQQEGVLHTEGPVLILAGAGSGKTRVVTHRIAYLLKNKGVFPGNILAITFTNKAAKEMKERIESLVGQAGNDIWISTFHSACVRILRRDIEKIDFSRNFIIYDTSDQKVVIKDCLKELRLNESNYPISNILSAIGSAKDDLLDPESFAKNNQSDFRLTKIADIYKLYQQKLKQNNALDFDDIIGHTIKLFIENPRVLEYYQKRFKYIHVDEYQDTNKAQYTLISLLAKLHKNLCVVGDDDQSIYMFRGADITNILDFEKEFKGAKVIKLERNYRSTKTILDAANGVIKHNMGRKQKVLWTDNDEGNKIRCFEGNNEQEEALFLARQIKSIVKEENSDYRDFAILYRMNAQSRVIEERLMREGIPYQIFGGLKFYDRKEIKDVIAYLRLINNTSDNYAFKRVINEPKRGLGSVTVDTIESLATNHECSMFDIISSAKDHIELQRVTTKLSDFCGMIDQLQDEKEKVTISILIGQVIEKTGILAQLEVEKTTESEARIENIKELISAALEFEKQAQLEQLEELEELEIQEAFENGHDPIDYYTSVVQVENQKEAVRNVGLEEFLTNVSLVADIDNHDEIKNNVSLMTIHSAKGLEFPFVFMVGLEEGVFPGHRSLFEESKLEEERRLCYVGITRAKSKLFITNTISRTIFGKTTSNRISRFVEEIPQNFIDKDFASNDQDGYAEKRNNYKSYGKFEYNRPDYPSRNYKTINSKPSTTAGDNIIVSSSRSNTVTGENDVKVSTAKYAVGNIVMHSKFGKGVITKIEEENGEQKLEIVFNNLGLKRLMAAYANLKKIN